MTLELRWSLWLGSEVLAIFDWATIIMSVTIQENPPSGLSYVSALAGGELLWAVILGSEVLSDDIEVTARCAFTQSLTCSLPTKSWRPKSFIGISFSREEDTSIARFKGGDCMQNKTQERASYWLKVIIYSLEEAWASVWLLTVNWSIFYQQNKPWMNSYRYWFAATYQVHHNLQGEEIWRWAQIDWLKIQLIPSNCDNEYFLSLLR